MFVNLPTGFPASSSHCRVLCNLADSSRVKTSQKSMIFTGKKKNYTHVAMGISGHFGGKKETNVI